MEQENAHRLAHLPFFSPLEFDRACLRLKEAYDTCVTLGGGQLPLHIDVRGEDAARFLRLKQPLQCTLDGQGRDHAEAETDEGLHEEVELSDYEEADELIVEPERPSGHASAEFDVLLSPTYRVPVLYFRLADIPSGWPQGLDFVYQCMVPKNSIAELQSTGVMGGISIQNHPITDIPSFMVHPCNTPDAMRELLGTGATSELQYLQVWFGLIGASVGLHLPKELAVER